MRLIRCLEVDRDLKRPAGGSPVGGRQITTGLSARAEAGA
jgi:hypothetical protein